MKKLKTSFGHQPVLLLANLILNQTPSIHWNYTLGELKKRFKFCGLKSKEFIFGQRFRISPNKADQLTVSHC